MAKPTSNLIVGLDLAVLTASGGIFTLRFSFCFGVNRCNTYKVKQPDDTERLAEYARVKTLDFLARSEAGSKESLHQSLYGEAVAAFGATSFDYFLTGFGRHALEKTAAFLGFAGSASKCSFHYLTNS